MPSAAKISPAAMLKIDRFLDRACLVHPGRRFRLASHDPGAVGRGPLRSLGAAKPGDTLKGQAQRFLRRNLDELAEAQELLWANDSRSLLVVLQAMDAAGKDGTIKHVMSGVNPTGCRVVSFKAPNKEELDHNWLWRIWRNVPERGQICIFNRSHYEDVLVVRVHPELLDRSGLPPGRRGKEFWQERCEDINAFERHLARNGTTIVKIFLNVSKGEQKRRFIARLDEPDKNWKFSAGDVVERVHWDAYMAAYEKAMGATSTSWAPWFVVPADHKWITRVLVGRIITRAIASMKLEPPRVSSAQRELLLAARRQLARE
ncbi:MAG: polyphosphate kinase 2 family protein [Phycisphaerales bacterium]